MTRLKGTTNDQEQETVTKIQRGIRQNNVWTREKTARLIRLYRKHECLWNNYIEAYKLKEKRKQAIEEICAALRISKFEYGKKIHNLRNQFNAEMKKLERRIEESGGKLGDGDRKDDSQYRCRWDHYESLLFLKDVIAPRPGYQSSGAYNYQNPRKMEIKYHQHSSDEDDAEATHVIITRVDDLEGNQTEDASTANDECTIDDESHIQYAVATPEDKLEMVEEDEYIKTGRTAADGPSCSQDVIDKKYNPSVHEVIYTTLPSATSTAITGKKAYFTAVAHDLQQQHSRTSAQQKRSVRKMVTAPALQSNQSTMQSCSDVVSTITESAVHLPEKAADLNNSGGQASAPHQCPTKRHLSDPLNASSGAPIRDQWDAFGEMVAAELRNLNSDISRKKLKRKMMQAILEVGEADDGIYINNATN